MTMKKILCPTDFSLGSQQALRVAVRLANEHDAELVIVHAWYVPPMMYAGEYIFPPTTLGAWSDDAQLALDGVVGQATAAGAKHVSSRMLKGVPWSSIVELLEKEAFDLCVIGTHGRTGLSRVLLGSVAEKIVRHAPCSVLVVRPDSEPHAFARVLCPTDFSANATHALDVAAEVVERGGSVELLHIIEVPVASGPVRVGDFARDLDARVAAALESSAALVRGRVRVTTSSRIGAPGAQTLAVLEEDPAIDLVVVGSHGRTGIKRALLGSVAEKIVRHARCPVLVARERT